MKELEARIELLELIITRMLSEHPRKGAVLYQIDQELLSPLRLDSSNIDNLSKMKEAWLHVKLRAG